MAKSNEKQTTKKTTAEKTTSSSKQTPLAETKKSRNYLTVFSLILAFIAIGTAIYTMQVNYQLQNEFQQQKNTITTRLSNLRQQQTNIENNLEVAGKTLKKTEQELQNRLESLNQQIKLTVNQRFYEQQDWLLLKARYYLELAQINAHWNESVPATITLLKQADAMISQLNSKKAYDVRQAIAQEIAQLKAMPKLDAAGILSQLDAAQQTISRLPLAVTVKKVKEEQQENKDTAKTDARTWRKRLHDSVNMLEKLVVIRRHNEDIKPLLSPLYSAVVRETIQLNLQEAQWAVLNENSKVFQIALQQAINNIQQHFDTNASITNHLLADLRQLKKINLDREKPKINKSLPLLNHLIKEKLLKPKVNGSKAEGEPSR